MRGTINNLRVEKINTTKTILAEQAPVELTHYILPRLHRVKIEANIILAIHTTGLLKHIEVTQKIDTLLNFA